MRASRPLILLSIVALLGGSVSPIPVRAADGNLPGGTSISVKINTPADGVLLPPGPVTVTGTAAVGAGKPLRDTTLTYVLDVSGSTTSEGCGGNQNGDGSNNDILDCEIAAAKELNNRAVTAGTVDKASVAVFGTGADTADVSPAKGDQVVTDPEATAEGGRNIDVVLSSVRNTPGGVGKFEDKPVDGATTHFVAGIEAAKRAAAATGKPHKIVVFMSDGLDNDGIGHIEEALAKEPKDAVFHTFAVGPKSACDVSESTNTLGMIAKLTQGTCTHVESVDKLPEVVPGVIASKLTALELVVDDNEAVPIRNVTPRLPQPGPVTVNYSVAAGDLAAGPHRLCVTATGSDGGGPGSVTECRSVVVDTAPAVDAGGPYTGNEDSQVPIAGKVVDPDGPSSTVTWSIKPGSGTNPDAICTFADAAALSTTVSCSERGVYDLTLTVSDGLSPPVSDSATMTLANRAPTVSAGGPYEGQEDIPVPVKGTTADPDNPNLVTKWTITPAPGLGATCSIADPGQLSTVVTCTEQGTYTLILTVTDGINPPVVAQTTLTLAPEPIGALSLSGSVNPAAGFVGGDAIVVTYTARNSGATAMAAVRFTPSPSTATVLPAGCGSAGGCELGTLAPGQVVQVQFTFAATAPLDQQLSAAVTTSGRDIDKADNTAAVRVVIRQPTVTVDPPTGAQGFVTRALGKDFPPGARVRLQWSIGLSETPGEVIVRPDGTFDAQALIFPKDTRGLRILLPRPVAGPAFGEVRSNPFLVVPRTLKPLSFVIR